MQAVILAAGRGVRMGALTESTPKPMLQIKGRTLLEYKLAALPEEVDEVIIVVGYLGGMIQSHFGGEYNGNLPKKEVCVPAVYRRAGIFLCV